MDKVQKLAKPIDTGPVEKGSKAHILTHTHTHRSSISQNSMSHLLSELDEISDAELIKQVNDLKQQIKILTLENEIFERTLMRLEPALMHGVNQALDYANRLQSSSSLNVGNISSMLKSTSKFGMMDSVTSPSKLFTSPSRISTKRGESSARMGGTVISGPGQRINILERSELVSTEMEILVNNLEKDRYKAAKKHALIKAQLEEVGVRENDIEKASLSFNQEVIVAGWDKIAQRIPAEIWIRYMTDWFKIADSQIGKLRLRTSTLNTQYSKLKGQIKVKGELSESLRAVDFEKLKIENNECIAIIEKKLNELAELKKMTGDANLTLSIHKKAMMEQNTYLTNILQTIKLKETQTIELDKEKAVIDIQAENLSQKLDDIRKVRAAYEVPDIMDYVSVKAEVTDLKHSIKMLENRFHIQQIALTSINRKLHSMLQQSSHIQ